MKYKFIDSQMTYDGSQLASLHNYLKYEILGDSIVSWVGPCRIDKDKIVDGEDLLQGHEIASDLMLHFIVEVFETNLFSMASLQRIFCDLTRTLVLQKTNQKISLVRSGDDLYLMKDQDRKAPQKNLDLKLNISIATMSPTSGLIHFGINVDSKNTPVKTCSLADFQVEPINFANELMELWSKEYLSIKKATQKVRWVK